MLERIACHLGFESASDWLDDLRECFWGLIALTSFIPFVIVAAWIFCGR